MKKQTRAIASTLIFAMLLGVTACSKKDPNKSKKKFSVATQAETTEAPSETTESTTESTTETTTETTTEATSNPLGLKIDVPQENCEIQFLPEEERFKYDMVLELNEADHTVGGHVVVNFYNNSSEEWNQLCMRDYSSLFKEAHHDGFQEIEVKEGALTEVTNVMNETTSQALTCNRDADVSVLWIPLDQNLKPGEHMTLSYDFKATIPLVADRYGLSDGVYNVTNFYPILAVYEDGKGFSHEAYYNFGECFYSEISDYHVTLTLPEKMKLLSTGVENTPANADGKNTYTIEAPCVRDFVFCASENFKFFEDDYDGIHIRLVYDEAHPCGDTMDACAEASLQAAKDSFAAFNKAFGKYPYPEVDIVLAPIDAGGMEYPNLIICTVDAMYCLTNSYESFPYEQMAIVVAHELGHQWFMGIVGNNSGMEPWLDESFASYTEFVFYEYLGVEDEMELYSRETFDLTKDPWLTSMQANGILPINRSFYDFEDADSYILAAYSYGKIALYHMEEILGREAFHGILREYVHRNAFTNSTASRFFGVLLECAGQDNADLNKLIEVLFDI